MKGATEATPRPSCCVSTRRNGVANKKVWKELVRCIGCPNLMPLSSQVDSSHKNQREEQEILLSVQSAVCMSMASFEETTGNVQHSPGAHLKQRLAHLFFKF